MRTRWATRSGWARWRWLRAARTRLSAGDHDTIGSALRSRLPGQPSSHAAERLGREAQVGRDHALRHTRRDAGIEHEEVAIPLLGVVLQRAEDPTLARGHP